MIVPAKRQPLPVERFRAARKGDTFHMDSGMGGSYPVEVMEILDDGRLCLRYAVDGGAGHIWMDPKTPEQCAEMLYDLVPENPHYM